MYTRVRNSRVCHARREPEVAKRGTRIVESLQLKLDQNQQIETDILELALAGRKIDAIAMARQRYGYDLTKAKQFVEELTA